MSYNLGKRTVNENSKSSPLKMVGPILKKYDEHRQKWNKIYNAEERNTRKTNASKQMKAILPKTTNGEEVSVEPELLGAVCPRSASVITNIPVPEEISIPVQEICAIARLAAEEIKCKPAAARHSRKRPSSSPALTKRKLLKEGKMVESALEVLKAERPSVVAAREEAYASNFFRKVKGALGETVFNNFCSMLVQLETKEKSVLKFYEELTVILASHPDLMEEFIPFLTAEQALECGLFMEHLMLTKMTDFLGLLDTHFSKTPYHVKKIHIAFEKLASTPCVTMENITSAILPLLKGNSVLTDYFLELLPDARPPEPFLTDFEELDEEALSDGSDDGEPWERIELPATPDPYGGVNCICSCHSSQDEKLRSRIQHCVPCSKKFINGKIFIQTGKVLRRGTAVFKDHDNEYHQQRLMPAANKPRKRKRSSSYGSPTKICLSSDEHKSDLDDDEKGRGKKPQKTPKLRRNTARRCLYNDIETGKDADLAKVLKVPKLDENKSKTNSSDGKRGILRAKIAENEMTSQALPLNSTEKTELNMIIENPKPALNFENSFVNPPTADTVTFLTASEALAITRLEKSSENRSSCKSESSMSEITINESKLEEPITLPLPDEKMGPILIVVPADLPKTSRCNSPPVLSIPETSVLPPGTDPLLSAIEEQYSVELVKNEVATPEEVIDEIPWILEEDRVILQTLQVETYCEETFVKISNALPSRSVVEIKKRFQELLDILYKMKSEPSV